MNFTGTLEPENFMQSQFETVFKIHQNSIVLPILQILDELSEHEQFSCKANLKLLLNSSKFYLTADLENF